MVSKKRVQNTKMHFITLLPEFIDTELVTFVCAVFVILVGIVFVTFVDILLIINNNLQKLTILTIACA